MSVIRYVVGFAFDQKEERLALMLKARPAWQRGLLNGVGGHIEHEESPEQAMQREWSEETSADEVQWRLFAILSGSGFEVFFFRGNVELDRIESNSDGEEIVVVDPHELPQNVVPNLRWLVPMAGTALRHDWPYSASSSTVDSLERKIEMSRSTEIELVSEFQDELQSLLNRYSLENGSDTPDFLLAEYLNMCLDTWNSITKKREKWYGRDCGNGQSILSALTRNKKGNSGLRVERDPEHEGG